MAIPSAITHNIMSKNIFPYTSWCVKICRENIFFRLEESHSSEQKLVSSQKLIILLLRDYLIHLWRTLIKIIGREGHNLARAIKEAIYIRVNNPTLNRNIRKYNLPHLWDRVLHFIPELKINK